MYGVIYLITCLINGKKYVGQTMRSLNVRIAEHKRGNQYIDHAIQKHGWENFTVEVLEECDTLEQLNEREIFWIAELNCKNPNGYNQTDGGEGMVGCSHLPEAKLKMSESAKSVWEKRTPEERAAIARKREANRSPEEKSATARARELAKSPEERSKRREKAWAKKSPEERSAIVRKAWGTRKANVAAKTPEEKAAAMKSPKELSEIAKKAAAKVDKKKRNAKISATWKLKSPEEIAEIVAKRLATRRANKILKEEIP